VPSFLGLSRLRRHWNAETIRRANERIASGLALLKQVFERHDAEARFIEPMRAVAYPSTTPAATANNPIAGKGADWPATLHAMLDAYVKAVEAKPLSISYKRRVVETINDLKDRRPDAALATVDRVWLEQLVDEIKARPLSSKKSSRTGKREPIAPGTVKTLLQHWCQALDRIDRASDSDRMIERLIPCDNGPPGWRIVGRGIVRFHPPRGERVQSAAVTHIVT
jgi:hypothetical protein